MLLAHTLSVHTHPSAALTDSAHNWPSYTFMRVLSWFIDEPHNPFGIHAFVSAAEAAGKAAGSWIGPHLAAHIIMYDKR